MKILYLGKSLDEHSGWGRYAWEVIRRVRRYCEVKVLVEQQSGKDCEERVLQKATGPFLLFKNHATVAKVSRGFDLVHALDGWPYAVYAAAANKPFFATAVGTYAVAPLDRFGRSWLLKKAYHNARKIFCISHYTKAEIAKRVKLNNLAVVHLGVALDHFKNLNLARDPNLIVGVGAVKPRKGYHIALQAIKILKPKFPQIHYVIAGGLEQNSYVKELQNFITEHKLENTVEFVSDFSDQGLVKLYNQASAFMLLPQNDQGHFEGFGLVFLEAEACGLPVVGTLGNGDEDAVADGETGFLVPQNNPAAAAAALEKILLDRALWQSVSLASQEFAKNFSWEKTADFYLQAYQNALA